MGIKNFQSFVDVVFGKRYFKEFAVNDVCYNIKDFSHYKVTKTATPDDRDNTYGRCGIYIDLSSYMYGRMLKSIEKTDLYTKWTSSVENTSDNVKPVVCELDANTIDRVVGECAESLLNALEPMLLKAYRVYLAYDTVQPKAKFFEQSRRRRRSLFHLSADSRRVCFENIAKRVKERISNIHMSALARYDGRPDSSAEAAIRSKLFSSIPADSTMGEGEWKCFYQIYQDICDGAVDIFYVFGRDWDIGLAMTMYQHPKSPDAIKYVYGPNDLFEHDQPLDKKARMLHFICLSLFGNDYIGGLVNLSRCNVILMKYEMDEMYSGDAGPATSLQVEYLSDLFFGHEMLADLWEERNNDDGGKREHISRAFAAVVLRLLAAVYGDVRGSFRPHKVEGVLHYAALGPFPTSLEGGAENASEIRKLLDAKRIANELNTTEDDDEDFEHAPESARLVCRDANDNQITRTLQQCMDLFAMSMLWYLSYATFYFRSPTGRKMMGTSRRDEDVPMLAGMNMGVDGAFRFNDERLSNRFDLCKLLELKKILQFANCCRMYWIVESAFARALNSK